MCMPQPRGLSGRCATMAISDDGGKYGIYDAEAGAAMDARRPRPQAHQDAFARFNSAVMDAWGLLSPERQRPRLRP